MQNAVAFLKPPHRTKRERAEYLQAAAALVRQAVKLAVLGGSDELAMQAAELARRMERKQ